MREETATPMAGRLLARWMQGVARRPRAALAVLAALVVLSAWSAAGLRVDTDSSRMLNPDLPFQSRAHALNEAFPALKHTIVVVVEAPTPDSADAAVSALVTAMEGRPGIERVFAPATDPFFLRNGLLYLDRATLEERLTRLSKSANMLAALRADRSLQGFLTAVDTARALSSRRATDPADLAAFYAEAAAVFESATTGARRPFAWMAAMTPGADAPVRRLVSVQPVLDFDRLSPAKPAIRSVRAAIANLGPDLAGGTEIGLTGEPVLRAEELASVTRTLPVSLALSLGVVALVLWLALGSVRRAGLAFGALLATLVLTAGAAAVSVGALNLVSIAFVVLMTGLGIDFAIHVMAHLEEDARLVRPLAALARTGLTLGAALGLAAASTAAAFLAFTPTDFVGMAQLGVIGAMGVVIAFAVAVTLIPAAIGLAPSLATGRARPRMAGLAALEARRAAPVGALVLGLVAAAIATQARFEADPMALRDPAAASVQWFDRLAGDAALAPLRLSLIRPGPAAAQETVDSLDTAPGVRNAVWLGDLVPADQDAKLALIDLAWPSLDFAVNGDAAVLTEPREVTLRGLADDLRAAGGVAGRLATALDAYSEIRSPQRDAVVEAALFRHFPALVGRLEAQLGVDRVTPADLPAALSARYVAPDGRYRVEIVPEADITDPVARRRFVEAVTAVAGDAAGPPAQIVGAGRAISDAMLLASALALGACTVLAAVVLRRVALVAAILVPVVLAGAVTMAASVLLGLPFNYANVIVLPLMIGIGVDSSIHLAMRTLRSGAVAGTATPRAVAFSALTTIGAFATLALSDHRGTASMGAMLAIALVAAVAMAFALTPALVRLAERRGLA